MICAICLREVCEDEAMCALFWNLEQFNDYDLDDECDVALVYGKITNVYELG